MTLSTSHLDLSRVLDAGSLLRPRNSRNGAIPHSWHVYMSDADRHPASVGQDLYAIPLHDAPRSVSRITYDLISATLSRNEINMAAVPGE